MKMHNKYAVAPAHFSSANPISYIFGFAAFIVTPLWHYLYLSFYIVHVQFMDSLVFIELNMTHKVYTSHSTQGAKFSIRVCIIPCKIQCVHSMQLWMVLWQQRTAENNGKMHFPEVL